MFFVKLQYEEVPVMKIKKELLHGSYLVPLWVVRKNIGVLTDVFTANTSVNTPVNAPVNAPATTSGNTSVDTSVNTSVDTKSNVFDWFRYKSYD